MNSLKKQSVCLFQVYLMIFSILVFGSDSGAPGGKKYVHIVLTPEEAMIHEIDHYGSDLKNLDLAKKKANVEKVRKGWMLLIGISAVSALVVYSVAPPVSNLVYQEAVEKGLFKGLYRQGKELDQGVGHQASLGSPVVPAAVSDTSSDVSLFSIATNPDALAQVVLKSIGKYLIRTLKASTIGLGKSILRSFVPGSIQARHSVPQITDLRELANELNFEGTDFTKKSALYLAGAITGNLVSAPYYFWKFRQIETKNYRLRDVDEENLKSAFRTIKKNADLACQQHGATSSIGIEQKTVKTIKIRLNHIQSSRFEIYLHGRVTQDEDLVALDIEDDGVFYYLDTFYCRMKNGPHKSINELIEDSRSKESVS